MADTKISEMAALAGADVADGDLLPIVDISAAAGAKNKTLTPVEARIALVTAAAIEAALGYEPATAAQGALADSASSVVGARAYNSALQLLATATDTPVTFDTEYFDTSSIHSTSSNTSHFVAPIDGYYTATASIVFATHGTGIRALSWYKNGSPIAGVNLQQPGMNAGSVAMISTLPPIYLAATDYVEVYAYQTSGVNLNIGSNSHNANSSSVAFWYLGL